MTNNNETYMKIAIDLAQKAGEKTYPNPLVGAIIVSEDNEIIGAGYHTAYGNPHAEVEALKSVSFENKTKLKNSTIFVNLEPCCHHGKTPPCVDAILASGIKKVVVANVDCNPKVCGQGIEVLRQNDVEVLVGILEEEGKNLNKKFFERFE
jgi:diaminohydroxyphosphoribosylaminopyrimidine deaminase/5-amino-6-(5-phosphoribosylamino)uracil reductase